MMPIIRPLHIPETERTEYQKEREGFSKMQVRFHRRNRKRRSAGRLIKRLFQKLRRIGWTSPAQPTRDAKRP